MASLKFRSTNKDETSYAYRLSVVCFGKTIELGVPYDDISTIKTKGRSILAQATELRNRIVKAAGQPARKTKIRPTTKASVKRRKGSKPDHSSVSSEV